MLGKWYLNSKKTQKKSIVFSEYIQLLKEKINSLKMCFSMNDSLDDFNKKFGVLDLWMTQQKD